MVGSMVGALGRAGNVARRVWVRAALAVAGVLGTGVGLGWLSSRVRGRLVAGLLALGLAGPSLVPVFAEVPVACPPLPQPPTQQEIADARARFADDRGMLWRVTRDGHTSHLYGTIHVGRLAWAFYGPQMSAALRGSDVLALELDPTDPGMAASIASASQSAGGAPTVALPPDLAARLREQWTTRACLPPAAVEAMTALHPALQVISLMTFMGRADGLEPGYGQEFVLAGLAKSFQRPIVALETAEQQMRALVPTNEEMMQRGIRENLAQVEDGRARATLARLADIWERGDLATLEDYESWCGCVPSEEDRDQMRVLNDGRNANLAEGIDRLHREGKHVFAAVGVLHMSGDKSLPKLLAEKGYTVERVLFAPAPAPAPGAEAAPAAALAPAATVAPAATAAPAASPAGAAR